MPDDIKISSSSVDPDAAPFLEDADRVAEIAAAAARAGRPDRTPGPLEIDETRGSELDAAFAEVSQNAPPAPEGDLGLQNGGVPRPVEGAPKKPADAPAPAPDKPAGPPASADKPDDPPADPDASKGLLDTLLAGEKAGDKPAPTAPAKDPYEDHKLRADASERTKETFEKLKTIAREREEQANKRASEAETQLKELQTKVAELEKRTVPDDVKKELEELRQFRATFDAEHSPEFKQRFDGRIEGNYEAIYTRLKAHALPDDQIALLKGMSPADREEAISGFLDKLPAGSRRFIELKLADNLNAQEERQKAVAEVKSKADKYLEEQRQRPVQQTQERDAAVAGILKPVVTKLAFLHPQEVPANASAEEKKAIESFNQNAFIYQEALKRAIVDDSPEVRAEAALAVPLARHLQFENRRLTAELTALRKEIDGIKAASKTSRLSRTVASPAAAAPAQKAAPANEESGDALDRLFAETTGGSR